MADFSKRENKRKKKEKWRHSSSNNILQLSCSLAVSFPPVIKFSERKRRVSPFFGGSVAAGLVTCLTHAQRDTAAEDDCLHHTSHIICVSFPKIFKNRLELGFAQFWTLHSLPLLYPPPLSSNLSSFNGFL